MTSPASGRQALSATKMKLVAVAGGVLIAIGVAGMIIFGLQTREALGNAQVWEAEGFWLQMKDYIFVFAMIAGILLILYGLVSIQRINAKRLGNAR